ncbi:hypothetical protein GPJ56_006755 [Histomonas meleagridis]|uniref:uncharacterized protein n=1 Tax=Histomonas meleagridis TaxID=135588 RepID=UPI00355A3D29|nr:hypothetical protein GPJ56_006755 [Histomonas meleagridis]KAH0802150.1 hypothetical protein GO595_005009 [Histomonas meleagridis]
MEEEEEEKNEINITYSGVYGPFLYSDVIPNELAQIMAGHIFRFFIPSKNQLSPTNNSPNPTYGTDIYPSNSSFHIILFHQGVIFFKKANSIMGARVANVFDDDLNVINSERKEIKIDDAVGFEIVFIMTDKMTNFIGSEQFGIKTKTSTKKPMNGIAVLFAQPLFQEVPNFPMNQIYGIDFNDDDETNDGCHWLRFGLSGEATYSYNVMDFIDDGLPMNEWLFYKLKKMSVYFDTDTTRYELAMNTNLTIKFSRLKPPYSSIKLMEAETSPTKDAKKEILKNNVTFDQICWNEHGIKIEGEQFGEFMNYFWCRRKRLID